MHVCMRRNEGLDYTGMYSTELNTLFRIVCDVFD